VRRDVHTRFSADGASVDVVLGSAAGTPSDDVAALLHAATAALEQARAAGRAPRAA
jgi:PleD family two-component response regulator